MSEMVSDDKESPSPRLPRSLVDSRLVGWISNLPPIAWAIRTIVRTWSKRGIREGPDQDAPTDTGLDATLQRIAHDVVNALGYAGVMVATYEQGDALTVHALCVDPAMVDEEQIRRWEAEASRIAGKPLSLTDPKVARVYRYREEHEENLSVRSVKEGKPVTSDTLFDLVRPIAPLSTKPFVEGIQKALGIQEVVAVPFFLETKVNGQSTRETVGCLFAAKRDRISEPDKLVLAAFGQQAAAAIESERRRLQIQVAQEIVFGMQTGLGNEERVLLQIVEGVVDDLGYAGAMVSTHEADGAFPVRALYVAPEIASQEQIHAWEAEASRIANKPLSLTDPDIARVYIRQKEYEDNLLVRAFQAGKPLTSDSLFDLFAPITPPSARPFVEGIQQNLGIQQVIVVPFFLETFSGGQPKREIVGTLFAATRSRSFSHGEIELLQAFGQQAAIGIRNARLYCTIQELYHKAEERRQAAEIFGRMAFSAVALVHALRNHIGAFRTHLQLVEMMSRLPAERQREILSRGPRILERLDGAADILDHLDEPWLELPDVVTDINACLVRAREKVILGREEIEAREGIVVHELLAEDAPTIRTSPDMLTETFKILIMNAVEAIRHRDEGRTKGGDLWIESRLYDQTTAQVLIRDNGIGIRPENMNSIFEMRWPSRETGTGFGLFWTKYYIEGLGGTIKAESVWQEGTTFFIHLPVSQADESFSYPEENLKGNLNNGC